VGAGFIGSECAASLIDKYGDKLNIHLIDINNVPLKNAFGEDIGKVVMK
jgi:malate/lactate dehydrogenase